jgi:hypothetical protein
LAPRRGCGTSESGAAQAYQEAARSWWSGGAEEKRLQWRQYLWSILDAAAYDNRTKVMLSSVDFFEYRRNFTPRASQVCFSLAPPPPSNARLLIMSPVHGCGGANECLVQLCWALEVGIRLVASREIKSERMRLQRASPALERSSPSTCFLSRQLASLTLLDSACRLVGLIAGTRLTLRMRGPESVIESISASKISLSKKTSGAREVS